MKKYIQIFVLVILVVGGTFIVSKNKSPQEDENTVVNSGPTIATTSVATTSSSLKPAISDSISKPKIQSTAGLSIPDKAWVTFQNYLEYARVHDIAGVKSLAYKFTGTCSKVETGEKTKEECFAVLDNLYKTGITLKKSDFANIAFDNKQVILSTDISRIDKGDKVETSKNLIYFTISSSGEIKLLGLEIGRSFSVIKNSLNEEDITSQIEEKTKDSDKDGIEDRMETCSVKLATACTPTDPKNKDTDGDGYWDGLKLYL